VRPGVRRVATRFAPAIPQELQETLDDAFYARLEALTRALSQPCRTAALVSPS